MQKPLPIPLHLSESTRFGIPAHLTQPPLQQEVFKELINKFAWAIGSTYRLTYSKRGSNVRIVAQELASHLIKLEGYPLAIAKSTQPEEPEQREPPFIPKQTRA